MSLSDILRKPLGWVERRLHPRSHEPVLKLTVGRQSYLALDWSLGGCRIKAEPGEFKHKQKLEGRVTLAGPNPSRGEFVAEVVRVTDSGEIGLRWLELSAHLVVSL
jgi:hypothetical protein